MRIFIGVPFPKEVKDYLYELEGTVKLTARGGNFTHYDNFHLTLSFIGEVNPSEIDRLSDILLEGVSRHSTLELNIGGLGSFKRKEKHIVFCEVINGLKPLKALQHDLEQKLLEEEFLIDVKGKFKPHITLGREVKLQDVSLLQPLKSYPHPVKVDHITLFESTRVAGVLTYVPLYDANLKD